MTATACPSGIDLNEIHAAVGEASFKRGQTYARGQRVMSVIWDDTGLLHGKVVGHGAIYDTAAYFSRDAGALEFEEGECSCPIGYNCKHVAALVIAADRDGQLGGPQPAAGSALGDRRSASPGHQANPVTSTAVWEQPLRAMLAAPAGSATGSPLAVELSVGVKSSAATPGAPRLQARLMRAAARGGWVNGSLSWGSLESWRFREADYREDHLALAREFHAVHHARLATTSRYCYGHGDQDRTLDLTDWDGAQLWALLDQATRIGMVVIHAGRGLGEVPRYRRGDLVLDVTEEPDGDARVAPTLRIDPIGELGGYAPLPHCATSCRLPPRTARSPCRRYRRRSWCCVPSSTKATWRGRRGGGHTGSAIGRSSSRWQSTAAVSVCATSPPSKRSSTSST